MTKKKVFTLGAFFCFILLLFLPPDAQAVPMFARQVGRDCTHCHTLFPKLNETGRIFRANGFRFADEGEWLEARDITVFPISAEVEIEGIYNRVESSGVETQSSDMKVEEVELFAGGALGKTGRVTAFGVVAFEQESDGSFSTNVDHAFVQVNDLIGPRGAGALNIRAGQTDLALPFIGGHQKFIGRGYLAETIGVFTRQQRFAELNGSVVSEDEESWVPTHRYRLGVSREDVSSDDKLKGYYAVYSLTFREAFNIGAIYRRGEEESAGVDVSYDKYGAAGEIEVGPVIVAAGFFRSDREGLADQENYLVEALVFPLPRLSVGARYDVIREDGKKTVKAPSAMVRYNILSNVFTRLEARLLSDDDHVIGSNDDELLLRLFLVALF